MSRNVLRFDVIVLMINNIIGKTLIVIANEIIMTDGFISSLGMIVLPPSLLLLIPYIVAQLPPCQLLHYAITVVNYESVRLQIELWYPIQGWLQLSCMVFCISQ